MAKKMKFERKAARQERSEPTALTVETGVMPPPSAEPVKEEIAVEVKPAVKSAKPTNPTQRIAGYVRSFDFPRLKAEASKAVQSGQLTDEQVDQAIDAALPDVKAAQQLPLNKLMAVASIAGEQKRQEYMPLLQVHAEHAKNLPEAEQGQIKDHLDLIGFLGEPQQEMVIQ